MLKDYFLDTMVIQRKDPHYVPKHKHQFRYNISYCWHRAQQTLMQIYTTYNIKLYIMQRAWSSMQINENVRATLHLMPDSDGWTLSVQSDEHIISFVAQSLALNSLCALYTIYNIYRSYTAFAIAVCNICSPTGILNMQPSANICMDQ